MLTYFWDIETSKITCDNDEIMQVTYLSNVLPMDYETGDLLPSIFHRTIEEVVEYFKTLQEEVIIWSHNLDYELTFLLRELGETNGEIKYNKNGVVVGIYEENVQDIILRDKHSPLSIKLTELPNITFRDTYAIFNKSVARLGDEIGLEKLEYNYKKVRLPWDELEELDYKYNERDNVIVAKSLHKYMQDNNLTFDKIPLTFTSFVKRKRKEFIIENYGKKAINKFYFDRNEQLQDFTFFELILKTFQGGLTASNVNETGKLIDDGVFSFDKKSDYPFQMCDKYFPFYSHKNTENFVGELANDYYKNGIYKGFFGTFKFTNIRVKNRNYLLPISSSQLSKGYVSNDRVLFNGKLLSASEIILPANDVDIETIKRVYKYDEIECMEIYATNKQRKLRQEEVSFLLNAFHKKETIKDKEDIEYTLSKTFINSMFGVKVTAPIKSSYSILEGEIFEVDYFTYGENERKIIYESFIEKTPMFSGTLDIFTDGCYITSYGRYELIELACLLVDEGCHVVYGDTDSNKFYLNGADKDYIFGLIDKMNRKIVSNNKNSFRFKSFKEKFKINDKDYEKICKLGIWELENNGIPIPYFMTYGAKKYGYITHENKVKTTIAGCNKIYPSIAIKNLAKNENISILESFKIVFALGTQFDTTASGRTVAKIENRTREEMNHYTYKGRKINQYGGIIIEDTTYTLNVTLSDSKILNMRREDEHIISISLEGIIDYE